MTNQSTPLIQWTPEGLYCKAGDFHIDPHRAVQTAVVTHAHSDHARRGSKLYYSTLSSVKLLKCRLGQKLPVVGIPYGEVMRLGDVQVSFHSAGHILGSAQVRIQRGDEVWVASGDYKREHDPSCEPFETVPCDTYITEATFGTPKYVWDIPGEKSGVFENRNYGREIHDWWSGNASQGINSVLFGYSLGKAQRILAELAPYKDRPVLIHSSITELTQCYREEGRLLAPTIPLESLATHAPLQGELILAPPSILKDSLSEKLGRFQTAFASGWMIDTYSPQGSDYQHGFILSDHADWPGLNRTILETGAKQVFVMHRQNGALTRHLRSQGLDAHPVSALTPGNYQALRETNLSFF